MEIFDEVRESLVTYYILPLVKLSYKAFGKHFVTCRISENLKEVVVYLMPFCEEEYWRNPNFKTDYTKDLTTYAIFTLPEEFTEDIKLFSEGKYSKMSDKAKEVIYKHSGLHYNKKCGEHIVTDMKLLALSKHKVLRSWLIDNQKLRLCDKNEFIQLENPDIIYHGRK